MTLDEFQSVIPIGSICYLFEKIRTGDNEDISCTVTYLGADDNNILKFQRGYIEFRIPFDAIIEVYKSQGQKFVKFEDV